MGFLLQITMSCPRALSRQVAGAGCRCWCWLCTRWRQVAGAGAGAGCWVPVLVLVLLAGCARGGDRLLVLGAGRRCWCWCCELAVHVVETGCWCWVPVLGASAGAGADVAHRTLYGIRTKVCAQTVQPLTQLSAKTENLKSVNTHSANRQRTLKRRHRMMLRA